MSKIIGQKADAKFNAFAFETEDKNGNPVFMIGVFTDETYDSSTTRSGWFQYQELTNPDIQRCLSSFEEDFIGKRAQSGKPFIIYLDKMPSEVMSRPYTDKSGKTVPAKPRYDCRPVRIVGFEVE